MSRPSDSTVPGLSGNQSLFDSIYKQVCDQAAADDLLPEQVLAQIIYHSSYEMFYSEGMTLEIVQGVVEAAALTVAREYEEAESLEAGGAA